MKNLQILLALAFLASVTYAASAGGASNITIFGNEDKTACQLTLSATVQDTQILFTENVSNPNNDCAFQNLQFASAFRDDTLYGNITLAATNDSNILTGILKKDDLNTFNGTACGKFGDTGSGDILYACRFKYGEIFFYMAIFVNETTLNFDTTATDLFFPEFGTTTINSTNGTNLLTSNNKFPHIVGLLSQSCAANNSIITDLTKHVYITGTDSASNLIDLNVTFPLWFLDDIVVKEVNGPEDQYSIFKPSSQLFPFAESDKNNGCFDLGITWGQVISDLSSCAKSGCEVSFVIQRANKLFVVKTNGITTQAPAKNLRALFKKIREVPLKKN